MEHVCEQRRYMQHVCLIFLATLFSYYIGPMNTEFQWTQNVWELGEIQSLLLVPVSRVLSILTRTCLECRKKAKGQGRLFLPTHVTSLYCQPLMLKIWHRRETKDRSTYNSFPFQCFPIHQ